MIYLFLMMFETYTKSSKSRVFMGMLSILTLSFSTPLIFFMLAKLLSHGVWLLKKIVEEYGNLIH